MAQHATEGTGLHALHETTRVNDTSRKDKLIKKNNNNKKYKDR